MKSFLKNALHKTFPYIAGEIHALRDKQQIRRVEKRLGIGAINRQWTQHYGLSVLHGPFAGMAYVSGAVGSTLVPKLLGSYELELHSTLDTLIGLSPSIVVDIGCAEGYYAVGLARRLPQSHIFAFDTASEGRNLCAQMARANGVKDRITIAGACSIKHLDILLRDGNALVICDCEGCEYQLLKPHSVPNLKNAFLIVELHPWVDIPSAGSFIEDFLPTHEVVLLTSTGHHVSNYPELAFLVEEAQKTAIDELRPSGQTWAILSPKTNSR